MAEKKKEKADHTGRTRANKERRALRHCRDNELRMEKFSRYVSAKRMDPYAYKLACDRMTADNKLTMSRIK